MTEVEKLQAHVAALREALDEIANLIRQTTPSRTSQYDDYGSGKEYRRGKRLAAVNASRVRENEALIALYEHENKRKQTEIERLTSKIKALREENSTLLGWSPEKGAHGLVHQDQQES